MKRFTLITVVIAAILWLGFAGYELFFKSTNKTSPQNIFCEADQGILLINRLSETKNADYLSVITDNVLSSSIRNLDSLYNDHPYLRVYASSKRNIIILQNEGHWKKKELQDIEKYFPQNGVKISKDGNYLLVAKDYSACQNKNKLDFFIEADKKASANYWKFENEDWKRTDIYNLNKGFFEYRSSAPHTTYGKAVDDVVLFSAVLPANISNYTFNERFYASAQDSVYKNGPLSKWIDLGYVSFSYRGSPVICSDYRSKQQPSLILIEKSTIEDSVQVENDIHSFTNFKLTRDFPENVSNRFYVLEIEDKVFFAESKTVLQQISVDYQLGKTLALKPERKNELFGGLPTYSNYRFVGKEKKMSITCKEHLLFEVNTQPPSSQLEAQERTTWSYSPEFKIKGIVPIPDHLRKGTSAFVYDNQGNYQLLSPNGDEVWKGSLSESIKGPIQIVDVFDNDKHQLLFHTENNVHLIDLNGNEVGGFPYKSEIVITSNISSFVWNGTKRFLIGTEKGEVIMLNSSGRELNIVQLSSKPITQKSFALNIKGNLRNWAIDNEGSQYIGYLETPAKAEKIGKTSAKWFVKSEGTVKAYFEKENTIYSQTIDDQEGKMIEMGQIIKADNQSLYVKREDGIVAIDHRGESEFSVDPSFNEINSLNRIVFNENNVLLMMDYLKNKIYLYNEIGNVIEGFPKEGRNLAVTHPNKMSEKLSIFTVIENAVICYKVKL
jgi:hypothetical protein